jgi:hypothetical protein
VAERTGPISLTLPPDPALARVVRLTAGGLVAMADFTIDELEDAKIAVSEVLIALVEHGDGGPVHLDLSLDGDAFEIRGRTAAATLDLHDPDLLLCRTVLAGVCQDHDIEVRDGTAHISATVARVPSDAS